MGREIHRRKVCAISLLKKGNWTDGYETMMNRLFNTVFENSLRMLLLFLFIRDASNIGYVICS